MIPAHLISDLRKLDRNEKLRVLQFLVQEIAVEEGALIKPGIEFPIWSPYNEHEAAQAMLELLQAHQHNHNVQQSNL